VTRLFTAIAASDRAAVADFVKRHADSINWRDHVGRTALHFALICSASDICKDLIGAGARMTARLVDGRTALHLACQMGLDDIVKAMLERSAKTKEEALASERAGQQNGGALQDDEKVRANIDH
jgi:ankyrin repeat protein